MPSSSSPSAKAAACALPADSLIHQSLPRIDYADAFEVFFASAGDPTLEDVFRAFFASSPAWIRGLMRLRNILASWVGLKAPALSASDRERGPALRPGSRIGPFRILERTGHEVIAGEDDKHLDFRISIHLQRQGPGPQCRLVVSTVVRFRNGFGKAYFLPVKLFHRRIVPAMLNGLVRAGIPLPP